MTTCKNPNGSAIIKLINFLHFAEGLKTELRNGKTSAEKHESVADHSWRVALMTVLFAPYLEKEINIEKALKIALIHDLVEIITGDKPLFLYEKDEKMRKMKFEDEFQAMKKIKSMLPIDMGDQFFKLWEEFEHASSYEGKFVKALDKIEAQLQHNEMAISNWNDFDFSFVIDGLDPFCNFDSFLVSLKNAVQDESRKKICKQ
jgi:putative hydrolase of HD superfamily